MGKTKNSVNKTVLNNSVKQKNTNLSSPLITCKSYKNNTKKPTLTLQSVETITVEPECHILNIKSEILDDNLDRRITKRKLHKTYTKTWDEEIAANGYARCIIATCNFISSSNLSIRNHFRVCNGFPVYDRHCCDTCECYLATYEELLTHMPLCKGKNKSKQKSVPAKDGQMHTQIGDISENRYEIWKRTIEALGKAFCGNKQCNFVATNLSDLENHDKFCTGVADYNSFCCIYCRIRLPSKKEHERHEANCSERSLSLPEKKTELHFKVINKMKDKITESGDHIIQPGPVLPKGQYTRRRPYTKQHKSSWISTLEKCKYVKCIFQNCYFIAMSLEDMIFHFGYCNGDGSFAKFECPHCNGRVTSEEILLKHIERSHANIDVKSEVDKDLTADNIENPLNRIESDNSFNSGESRAEELTEKNSTLEEVQISHNQKLPEVEKIDKLMSWRNWQNEINNLGYTSCRRGRCNFICSRIVELEYHLKRCDGKPNYELFNCQKCKSRLPTKQDLLRHESSCKMPVESEVLNLTGHSLTNDDNEDGRLIIGSQGNKPIKYPKQRKSNMQIKINEDSSQSNKTIANEEEQLENDQECQPPAKKRRGKSKTTVEDKSVSDQIDKTDLKCGKCCFKGTQKSVKDHILRKHVGLGWIEGEKPVDLNNDKEVLALVKAAFKVTKKGKCEICQTVKRSFIGFASHIQFCGKTVEEKSALKVDCPHCPGKYLKYSLAGHIKFAHTEAEPEDISTQEDVSNYGKRRSALKAVSKFQEEELEENDEKPKYILYEKRNKELPKLCSKLMWAWYKLKRENSKIPCHHKNCQIVNDDVQDARYHYFTCPKLPEKVFLCQSCDFYSVDEGVVQTHVLSHDVKKKRKLSVDDMVGETENDYEYTQDEEPEVDEGEEEIETFEEFKFCDVPETPKKMTKRKMNGNENEKKRKKKCPGETKKMETDAELSLKQQFCRRENLENVRGHYFYSFGLNMTLEEELLELEDSKELWSQLHTEAKDWEPVSIEEVTSYFPSLEESICISFTDDVDKKTNFRKFKRFEGDLVDDVPVMFVGGSIRSLSWCKISFKRMLDDTARQYLALSTSKGFDNFTNILEQSNKSSSQCNVLQIWDCGILGNSSATDIPKLSLGVVQEGGEIWDLSWFPDDTATDGLGNRLPRLGLLATASEDGVVRIWSVCDSSRLVNTNGYDLPIYKTKPVVKLIVNDNLNDSCLRVAVGRKGIVAGGFANGVLAVWNINNISSPFCKKEENCRIIKAHLTIQAHRTCITALTFHPDDSRYISTGALDRVVKLWDLESPSVPVEQYNRDICLDSIWARNWPTIIYNFDEVLPSHHKGVAKFIRDILYDKHQAYIILENACMSLTFSDWLNALCGCTNVGEVKVRLLKNFMTDQRMKDNIQKTISFLRLQELENGSKTADSSNEKDVQKGIPRPEERVPDTYESINSKFGLVIQDFEIKEKKKSLKRDHEELPIRAVNKVKFNPNFKSFTHLAVGYNCGLVRIQRLKELQSNIGLKKFLQNAQSKSF